MRSSIRLSDPPLHPEVILSAGEWECMQCGHVERGQAGRALGRCPGCGVSGKMLAFFDYASDYYFPRGGTIMQDRLADGVKGEWECDDCGYIRVGVADRPPRGNCPDCGTPADSSFTFYEYTDDSDSDDDDWDSDDDI